MHAWLTAACACLALAAASVRAPRGVPPNSYANPDGANRVASPPFPDPLPSPAQSELPSTGQDEGTSPPSPAPASSPAISGPAATGEDKGATTRVQEEMANRDGTFSIRYETSNGIRTSLKGSRKGHVMEGSYSYPAPDGRVLTTRWTADERGFRPEGAHLPIFELNNG